VHQSRRQQIVFGARGVTNIEIALYGPSHELHSGHYGNWAPNPAMGLARLLASMKDDDGRVLIDHFYDGIEPLTDTEKRAIAEAPEIDAELMRELALGRTEGGGRKLVELINLPSLNVRGMASARTGDKASNVVPSTAIADIDIRLVKGIDPDTAVRRVIDHVRKQGYEVVETEPDAAARMRYLKLARVSGTRLQRLADVDGSTHLATGAAHGGIGARPDCQTPHHGRQRAALHDRRDSARAYDYGADRESR
jgi:acetylornithine deacetylase/succinyl-diaminopimelate desuccinylase-like protein